MYDTNKFKTNNVDFASNDPHFLKCCNEADVKPTPRQASKFKNKRGSAYRIHRKIATGNRGSKRLARSH